MSTAVSQPIQRLLGHTANGWRLSVVVLTLVLWLPLAVIVASLAQPYSEVWQHLANTVLGDYVLNSLILMLGVALGTFILGTSTAWLTSMCQFPGRAFFEWALLLPMAMPAYIIAYTYTGMLDATGPLQSFLRTAFDWRYGDYWFPEIRSLGGAIFVFSFVLYPYVYLIVRAAFLEQSHALLEVSRSLGNGPWRTLLRVAMPAARPAIVAGMTLALMETLADYGTVYHFGISTFTTGIIRTWTGMNELTTAAQLASVLLLFVGSLIVIERWSRSRMRFHQANKVERYLARTPIEGFNGLLCCLWCALPLGLGFLVPTLQLLLWAWQTWERTLNLDFAMLVGNSFLLAALAAFSCLILAIVLCFTQRLLPNSNTISIFVRAATLGYAVPGIVIAVGVLIPFAAFDRHLDAWLREHFSISSGLLLSGTLFALVFAYTVRFVSVAVQTLESGYSKVRHSVDDSARTLGYAPISLLSRIHFPVMKSSLIAALLLVFVDVLKELPTTLVLRPFNFNTLAVRAYELASDERLMDTSTAALAIVAIGLLPVILLTRAMNKRQAIAALNAPAPRHDPS